MSGLDNNDTPHDKNCGNLYSVISSLLQAMTAQTEMIAQQNRLMSEIVAQNQELIAMFEPQDAENATGDTLD